MKAVVGVSGGVDSSVAAELLKQQGYDVSGLFLRMFDDSVPPVLGGIEIVTVDCRERFNEYVRQYYVNEYRSGHTPNPCVECNKHIKWRMLYDYAMGIGADKIATGHYASVGVYEPTGRLSVKHTGTGKDQSYVLYTLPQDILSRIVFPIQFEKQRVRELAREMGLPNWDARDSQDICFTENVATEQGNFIDKNGKVLGVHNGISQYTIGQRKGLGVALGQPMFVCGINAVSNEVTLGADTDLYANELYITDLHYMGQEKADGGVYHCKIRYAHEAAKCRVEDCGNGLRAVFDKAARAVTPGQSAVFYRDGHIMFGGKLPVKII
jgi:tRNA-specific 2-thiouridylase